MVNDSGFTKNFRTLIFVIKYLPSTWFDNHMHHVSRRFCRINKRFEISNLNLIKDMANITNLDEVLTEKRKDYTLFRRIFSI